MYHCHSPFKVRCNGQRGEIITSVGSNCTLTCIAATEPKHLCWGSVGVCKLLGLAGFQMPLRNKPIMPLDHSNDRSQFGHELFFPKSPFIFFVAFQSEIEMNSPILLHSLRSPYLKWQFLLGRILTSCWQVYYIHMCKGLHQKCLHTHQIRTQTKILGLDCWIATNQHSLISEHVTLKLE